tara:strand:- start:42436 stop:43344 length:909 start_codon:yes stop_codon:yes gene_type:complete
MLKFYLTVAVVVLIGITSMGIFGFLSKSHIEQQREVSHITNQLSQIEHKISNENAYIQRQQGLIDRVEESASSAVERTDGNIELEQRKITEIQQSLSASVKYDEDALNRLNEQLSTLDAEVGAVAAAPGGIFSGKKKKLEELAERQKGARESIALKKTEIETKISASRQLADEKIAAIRARLESFQDSGSVSSVAPDVSAYENNIRDAYGRVDGFETKKFELQSVLDGLEVEVGPIKYIAALIEDFGVDNVVLAEAVRAVILILVFVFDPLAVVMLLAANMNFRQARAASYEKLSSHIEKKN